MSLHPVRFLRRTPCVTLLLVQLAGVFYLAMVVTRLIGLGAARKAAR